MSRPRVVPNANEAMFRVLKALHQLTIEKGYPPSYREMAAKAGLTSTAPIHFQLAKAKKMGLVNYEYRKARTAVLTRKGKIQVAMRMETESAREASAGLYDL